MRVYKTVPKLKLAFFSVKMIRYLLPNKGYGRQQNWDIKILHFREPRSNKKGGKNTI